MVPSIHLTLLHVLNLHLFIIIVALAILRRAAALRCVLLLTEQVLHLIRRGHHLILVKVVRHMHRLLPLSISSFRLIQLIFNIDLLDLLANRLVTLV